MKHKLGSVVWERTYIALNTGGGEVARFTSSPCDEEPGFDVWDSSQSMSWVILGHYATRREADRRALAEANRYVIPFKDKGVNP